jgi:hypothetical protein
MSAILLYWDNPQIFRTPGNLYIPRNSQELALYSRESNSEDFLGISWLGKHPKKLSNGNFHTLN